MYEENRHCNVSRRYLTVVIMIGAKVETVVEVGMTTEKPAHVRKRYEELVHHIAGARVQVLNSKWIPVK